MRLCAPPFALLPEALALDSCPALADLCLDAATAGGWNGNVGVEGFHGQEPEKVAARLLHDLPELAREGRVQVLTSLADPFGWGSIPRNTEEGLHGDSGQG